MVPEFSQRTKDILARRAANACCNPECRATTSGPAVDPSKAINVGEAAHIYGANLKSARYRHDMTDGGRAEVANGIWLCCNCHKIVDNDPVGFPAVLLFSWRREHEKAIAEKLGKANVTSRLEMTDNSLPELVSRSPLARQIALSKDPFWEYRLTAEMLRQALKSPARKWRDLNNSLYTKKLTRISESEVMDWFSIKFDEAGSFARPLADLYSRELKLSWGEDGVPGDVEYIAHVCELVGHMGDELIRWEEELKFSWVPELYRGLRDHIQGAAGHQFEALMMVPDILDTGIDEAEANPGVQTIVKHTIIFDLPEGWEEGITREMDTIRIRLGLPPKN